MMEGGAMSVLEQDFGTVLLACFQNSAMEEAEESYGTVRTVCMIWDNDTIQWSRMRCRASWWLAVAFACCNRLKSATSKAKRRWLAAVAASLYST
jgi:hypothetical protein